MKYEITTPGAAQMVQQEHLTTGLALAHYRDSTVAQHVASGIVRAEWLASGGQHAVQLVAATLNSIANSPRYQEAVLQELLRRLGACGFYPPPCPYTIDGVMVSGSYVVPVLGEAAHILRLYRTR